MTEEQEVQPKIPESKAALWRRLRDSIPVKGLAVSLLLILALAAGIFYPRYQGYVKNIVNLGTIQNLLKGISLSVSSHASPSAKINPEQKITTDRAMIPSKIFPVRTKTFVKVKYLKPAEPFVMWLQLETNTNATPIEVLLDHPFLTNLTWESNGNTTLNLYQKNHVYASVEAFLRNPPEDKTIAADPLLIQQKRVPSGTISLDNLTLPDTVNFILTTYHNAYKEDGYAVAETVVDASEGAVTNDMMTWWLILPKTSEQNPLYLKGVDITYNQPS